VPCISSCSFLQARRSANSIAVWPRLAGHTQRHEYGWFALLMAGSFTTHDVRLLRPILDIDAYQSALPFFLTPTRRHTKAQSFATYMLSLQTRRCLTLSSSFPSLTQSPSDKVKPPTPRGLRIRICSRARPVLLDSRHSWYGSTRKLFGTPQLDIPLTPNRGLMCRQHCDLQP
jgi:hypothetical protein